MLKLNDISPQGFGYRLLLTREAREWIQERAAGFLGMTGQAWSHYELGRSPPLETVFAIASVLHVPSEWLMHGDLSRLSPEDARKIAERHAIHQDNGDCPSSKRARGRPRKQSHR